LQCAAVFCGRFPEQFFVLDVENGMVGRLKLVTGNKALFEVERGNLLIRDDLRNYSFKLSNLVNELKRNAVK